MRIESVDLAALDIDEVIIVGEAADEESFLVAKNLRAPAYAEPIVDRVNEISMARR
jgi:hypothetical protein